MLTKWNNKCKYLLGSNLLLLNILYENHTLTLEPTKSLEEDSFKCQETIVTPKHSGPAQEVETGERYTPDQPGLNETRSQQQQNNNNNCFSSYYYINLVANSYTAHHDNLMLHETKHAQLYLHVL